MISVVLGDHRTGTSLMMEALGIFMPREWDDPIIVGPSRGDDAYPVQPPGQSVWELNPQSWVRKDLHDRCEGRLVKCIRNGRNLFIPGRDYRIVVMRRNDEARVASARRMGMIGRSGLGRHVQLLHELDLDYSVVDFDQLIDSPLEQFTRLARDGWPIDPAICAAVVKPEWRRFTSQ